MNCIFCSINEGSIPSYTIYEDEVVKCILDIHPKTNGEILILTKKHFQNILDIDDETLLHVIQVARTLICKMENTMEVDGITLEQNNGEIQEVKHFHLHVKPSYKEDQPLLPLEEVYEQLNKI